MTILGVTGFARSGKDTFGQFLHTVGYQRVGFADQLKAMALDVDPLIGYESHLKALVYLDGWERAKDEHLEVRRFLQKLGVACREQFGEDAWVRSLARTLDPAHNYVVTDVRFENEAHWVRQQGGFVVRINRPGFGPVNDHESEKPIPDEQVDWQVQNDGSLMDLEIEARRFVAAVDKVKAAVAATA